MRIWRRLVLLCAAASCGGQDNPPSDNLSRLGTAQRADTCWRATPELVRLKEPALYEIARSDDTDAVRFLWFPTFDGTVSVRIVRRAETYALVSTQLPPDGDSALTRRDSLRITAARWAELTAPLRTDTFWSPEPKPEGVIRIDGSTWRVEAMFQGTCRAVKYWSPEVTGRGAEVRAFGTRMLDAAGVVPQTIY